MQSFNPQVIPSSLPKKEHHKAALVALWAALGAVIIGLVYWWSVAYKAPTQESTTTQGETAAEIKARLITDLSQGRDATVAEKTKAIESFSQAGGAETDAAIKEDLIRKLSGESN